MFVSDDVKIRCMEASDIESLVIMDQKIFSNPWSKADYNRLLELSYSRYLVAVIGETVIGFAGMMELAGEGDIDRVMVEPQYRGNHIAETLLTELFDIGHTDGVECYTLEVRVGNLPAIHLYEKMGFVNEGIRPNFYDDPKEDAMIMWRR